MPDSGREYPCQRNEMSLKGDCSDCLNRAACLKIPVKPLEFEIDISPDGTAATWWWTEELGEIMGEIGSPAPEYERVNNNPWCG